MVTATRTNGKHQVVKINDADYRILDAVRVAMEQERGRCVSFAEAVRVLIRDRASWAARRNGEK